MASKTTSISPSEAAAAGCAATCDSYYQGIIQPSYQGDVTLAYTNYQVVATGVGNWRPVKITVSHFLTYSDGSTGTQEITYRSYNYGDTNPWNFPAVQNFTALENPFEWTETDAGTITALRSISDVITSVEVEFEQGTPPPPTYTITTAVSPSGAGTTTGDGTYNSGATATLTATANSGYRFLRWELNGVEVSTSASYSPTVTADATYTAVFESIPPTYHVQVVAFKSQAYVALNGSPGDDIQSAWTVAEGDFEYGESITIAATPKEPTLRPFKAWYRDPSAMGNPEQTGTLVPGAGATYTTTVTANVVYFATVDNLGTIITAQTYSERGPDHRAPDAIVSINGQSDGDNDYVLAVLRGSSVTISTTAYGGPVNVFGIPLYFVGWVNTLDYSAILSEDLQYTFQSSQSEYSETFAAVYIEHYTLTTSILPTASAGTISYSPLSRYGDNLYSRGTQVTLIATPSAGYRFKHWTFSSGTVISTSDSIVVSMTVNQSRIAVFEPIYTISTDVSPLGAGTTSGDGTYAANTSCTLTATPNPGYAFSHWADSSGAIVSQSPQYSFTVTQDETLTAHFDEESESSSSEEWEEGPLVYDPATGLLRYDPVSGNLRYLRRQVQS